MHSKLQDDPFCGLASATAVHVHTLDTHQMAGSDPAESVTIYHGVQNTEKKKHLALIHCQVDIPEEVLDEGTPIHPNPNHDISTTSSASPLSFTKTIRQLLVSAAFLTFAVFFNLTILAVIHERVPMKQPPLPDVAFSLMPKNDHALDIAEYIIMYVISTFSQFYWKN